MLLILLDEPVARDRAPLGEQQQGQHRALLRRARVQLAVAQPHPNRTSPRWLAAAAFGCVFGLSANIAVVIGAGFATTISTVVQSNLVHIYQTELFHTANRSTAIGIPYAASRLVSALLPFSALTLLAAVGPGGLYLRSALLLATMALTVRILGPRTTNQRLDAI